MPESKTIPSSGLALNEDVEVLQTLQYNMLRRMQMYTGDVR
jgi:hypothetical protein